MLESRGDKHQAIGERAFALFRDEGEILESGEKLVRFMRMDIIGDRGVLGGAVIAHTAFKHRYFRFAKGNGQMIIHNFFLRNNHTTFPQKKQAF